MSTTPTSTTTTTTTTTASGNTSPHESGDEYDIASNRSSNCGGGGASGESTSPVVQPDIKTTPLPPPLAKTTPAGTTPADEGTLTASEIAMRYPQHMTGSAIVTATVDMFDQGNGLDHPHVDGEFIMGVQRCRATAVDANREVLCRKTVTHSSDPQLCRGWLDRDDGVAAAQAARYRLGDAAVLANNDTVLAAVFALQAKNLSKALLLNAFKTCLNAAIAHHQVTGATLFAVFNAVPPRLARKGLESTMGAYDADGRNHLHQLAAQPGSGKMAVYSANVRKLFGSDAEARLRTMANVGAAPTADKRSKRRSVAVATLRVELPLSTALQHKSDDEVALLSELMLRDEHCGRKLITAQLPDVFAAIVRRNNQHGDKQMLRDALHIMSDNGQLKAVALQLMEYAARQRHYVALELVLEDVKVVQCVLSQLKLMRTSGLLVAAAEGGDKRCIDVILKTIGLVNGSKEKVRDTILNGLLSTRCKRTGFTAYEMACNSGVLEIKQVFEHYAAKYGLELHSDIEFVTKATYVQLPADAAAAAAHAQTPVFEPLDATHVPAAAAATATAAAAATVEEEDWAARPLADDAHVHQDAVEPGADAAAAAAAAPFAPQATRRSSSRRSRARSSSRRR